MGMAYQASRSAEWLHQAYLSVYIHVYVCDMFRYSASIQWRYLTVCCSTQTVLKVSCVSPAMTASTFPRLTLVCRLVAPELPNASPWALEEGVFTKKQPALGKSPLFFCSRASGSNAHPVGTSHPWHGARRWHPCRAACIQHWGSTLLQTSQGPPLPLSLFQQNKHTIIFPHESAPVFRWTI